MENTEFRTKVENVAKILGYTVKHSEHGYNQATLERSFRDRFKENITIRSEKGRLNIHGWSPQARDGSRWYGNNASITVAATKMPIQIVKDITRRLLPEYRLKLGQVVDKIMEYESDLDSQASMVKALADIVGMKQLGKDNHGNLTGFTTYNSGFARSEVRVSGGSVTIELLGITFDEAKKVLTALKEK